MPETLWIQARASCSAYPLTSPGSAEHLQRSGPSTSGSTSPKPADSCVEHCRIKRALWILGRKSTSSGLIMLIFDLSWHTCQSNSRDMPTNLSFERPWNTYEAFCVTNFSLPWGNGSCTWEGKLSCLHRLWPVWPIYHQDLSGLTSSCSDRVGRLFASKQIQFESPYQVIQTEGWKFEDYFHPNNMLFWRPTLAQTCTIKFWTCATHPKESHWLPSFHSHDELILAQDRKFDRYI